MSYAFEVTRAEYPVFDAYFDYIGKSESPSTFIRWSVISGIGAMLGRSMWFPFGDFRIFPNTYVMLIGDPGVRKSTAIKQMRKVMSLAGYKNFAGDKTSKEKFLLDLEGREEAIESSESVAAVMEVMFDGAGAQAPREMYVVADEFNEFSGSGNLDFLSLLGSLWDWDDESRPFEQRFKNSRSLQIWQPTLSIIGGNTHQNLMDCFPPAAIGQGFMSRMLFVHAHATQIKIPFPTKPSDEMRTKVVDYLRAIRDDVGRGEAKVTPRARELLELLYRNWRPLDDTRFQHYSSRRFTHLLKLCLICAAARLSSEISDSDVVMANTLLSRAEFYMPDALGEFGKAKNADVAAKVLALIQKSSEAMPPEKIWPLVGTDLNGMDELMKVLANLQSAGKIHFISAGSERGYTPVRKRESNSLLVMRDWLRENIQQEESPY